MAISDPTLLVKFTAGSPEEESRLPSRLILTPVGFCLPSTLATSLHDAGYGVTAYDISPHGLHLHPLHPHFCYQAGQHLLYLPSILGVWALRQKSWLEAGFAGLITDGSLKPHMFKRQWVTTRLKWERARLGGDVGSFFLQHCLVKAGSSANFANFTINYWLSLFCNVPLQYSFTQDYVVDSIQIRDMKDWLVRRKSVPA